MPRLLLALVLLLAVTPPARAAEPGQPTADPRSLGNPAAPVTVIEFSDYLCPACAEFVRETKPQIVAQYIETGQVYYVYRDFPLAQHPAAMVAAYAASCAAEQGHYWAMHARLFEGAADNAWGRGSDLDTDRRLFVRYARDLGLDTAALERCMAAPHTRDQLRADLAEGQQRGVRGTPTFFINGSLVAGSYDFDIWQGMLDRALAGEQQAPLPEPAVPAQAPRGPALNLSAGVGLLACGIGLIAAGTTLGLSAAGYWLSRRRRM